MTESKSPAPPRYSVVVPVYNEGANIAAYCEQAVLHLPPDYELLICYDFAEDNTLPALASIPQEAKPPLVKLVKNDLGRGVRYAIEAGMNAARAPVVVVMMADLSDDFPKVAKMVARVEAGADVVCASRYMKGGSQVGGPWFKKVLSRSAGVSLHYLTGLPTHDPTNSFKAYRTEFLRGQRIESPAGFCLGLELTAKAHFAGGRVEQVPSSWTDRSAGESRFRLGKWLPLYLEWYAWTLDKSKRANFLLGMGLFAFALLLGILQLTMQPHLYLTDQYVTMETGNQLWRADQILQGKVYQRDWACQYGPLGPYLYACAAAIFGNTPVVCHSWQFAMNLLCLVLAYQLLRRVADLLTTFFYSLIVLASLFVANTSCCVFFNAEFISVERALMLGLALLWQGPDRRGIGQNILLGTLLGLMQWTKFGAAFFCLAAILALDLVWWLKHAAIRPLMFRRKSLVGCLALVGGFAALELAQVAWAYGKLPREMAIDTLWPSFMTVGYDDIGERRWAIGTLFPSVYYFVGRELVPFLASLVGLAGFVMYLRQPPGQENDRSFGIFLNLMFFLLAFGTYIAHSYHVFQYLFGPALAGIWLYRRQSWWCRIAFLIMMVPFAAVTLIFLVAPPKRADMAWYEVAPGQKLFLTKPLIRDLERMPAIRPTDTSKFLLVVEGWGGGGFHHYFDPQYPLRNIFIVRAGFRPYDVEELLGAKDNIHAVLFDSSLYANGSLEEILGPIIGQQQARELATRFADAPDPASGFYRHYAHK